MQKENRTILLKGIDVLHKLHFKNEDIMLTGSVALDMFGLLPSDRKPHDVDFILKTDEQTWRCLKLLEAVYSYDDNEYNEYNEYKDKYKSDNIMFNMNGWKLNLFKADNTENSIIKDSETGIFIATVDHIINKKKQCDRVKDYKDLNNICKIILK